VRATNWLASLRTDSDGEVRTEQQPSALMQQALRRLKRGGHIEADADLAVACIIAPNKRKPAALVFGHTHLPLARHQDGVLYLNPGYAANKVLRVGFLD